VSLSLLFCTFQTAVGPNFGQHQRAFRVAGVLPHVRLEPQQRLDVARVGHSLRDPLDRRHQQAVALFGHAVFVLLLAPRGHLPSVHQLHALGRREAVVRHPWRQSQGVQVRDGKDHEAAAQRVPRLGSVLLSAACMRAARALYLRARPLSRLSLLWLFFLRQSITSRLKSPRRRF
jgi:hypothetical protein